MADDLIHGIPPAAFFAKCHTFDGVGGDTDRAYPHICCADDCPARPYVRAANEPVFRVMEP